MFEDHFDDGMSPEWVSIAGTQWVEEGWLHTQDQDPTGPRGSAAVVHDGDTEWTDYELSLRVDPLVTGPDNWDFADVHFRTRDFHLGTDGPKYSGYNLHFHGLEYSQEPGYLYLTRLEVGGPSCSLAIVPDVVGSGPADVEVTLAGSRIRVSIDGSEVIDVVDPDPYLYGGIGIGVGWEAHARFDDVVVIPEPLTFTLLALGGLLVLRRHR